ncbi:SDR family NAD(P)-dependent oxidoreductase [Alicycliphilus denitrificans]|uniref:SDR family NAD(P)-dependent oxidoreductase n=1 Tax=Alicycliphilus denitrificans TaxID=179636 RepID=UPI003A7F687E
MHTDTHAAHAPRLQGRRILVVGAGQREAAPGEGLVGNGRAIALVLARHGAAVACADRSGPSAEQTCALIRAEGGVAHALVADAEEPAAIAAMVGQSAERLGGLDGVVAVVGVTCGTPLDAMTTEEWDRVYALNVRSHMLVAQHALRRMESGGSMVLLSSLAALRNSSRNPAYETTKAAQVSLARSIAMAGQAKTIRCNSVLPGLIDTPMGRDETARRPERLRSPLPFGRQGTPWEVANACLFLISGESSYVNGHALVVDGGLSAGITSGGAYPLAVDSETIEK